MNKDLTSGFDLDRADLNNIFKLAAELKERRRPGQELNGKVISLVFQKPSMRTRVSFEVGVSQLGGSCVYLSPGDISLGDREPVKDAARVLSRYVDGVICRTFAHSHMEELARYSEVPVINGLSDVYHPCQALADMFTILEIKGRLEGVRLAFVGDGNNVLHSLLAIAAKTGVDLRAATPRGFDPQSQIWEQAVREGGKSFKLTHDPREAVEGADFVYTDVWTSMGQESEREQRLKAFRDFQVNQELLQKAAPDCRVMHCMPVHRGEEVTEEVIESNRSVIIDQAENRLHVQKAVMALLFNK